MKKIFLLSFSFLFTQLYAQVNTSWQWIWVGGDTSTANSGVYGTQGNSSPTNKPGARWHNASWTDIDGNLWLFGGDGYGISFSITILSDLWKYDIVTKEWTWMKGGSMGGEEPVYGDSSVADNGNSPGARSNCAYWKDADGNFWLFGGVAIDSLTTQVGTLNDLWKYTPSTNQWTWMKGDTTFNSPGVYGTRGVSAPTNNPRARKSCVSWTDASGNLWLFGGRPSNTSSSSLNDLWKYDISTNEWTWIKGSNTSSFEGEYGTKGVPDTTNVPGPRMEASTWTDDAGDLWLFGGIGYATQQAGYGIMNDLWRYNIAANTWTWISGSDSVYKASIYGNIGVADVNNVPGSRTSSTAWVDTDGKLLLFGGLGYAASNSGFANYLNDLWKYDIAAQTWEWVKGDSVIAKAPNHGTKGVQSITNKPGARTSATGWIDKDGNLWLFGGNGTAIYFSSTVTGVLNDLWQLAPAGVQGLRFLQFNASLNNTSVTLHWQTAEESNTGYFNIQRSTDGVHFKNIGAVQAAGFSNSILNYQFSDDAALQTQSAQLFYRLQEVDKDNKFYYSGIARVLLSASGFSIMIYPNPAKDNLWYSINAEENTSLKMMMYNFSGKLLLQKTIEVQKGNTVIQQDISKLASGTYTLLFINEKTGEKFRQTFIKM